MTEGYLYIQRYYIFNWKIKLRIIEVKERLRSKKRRIKTLIWKSQESSIIYINLNLLLRNKIKVRIKRRIKEIYYFLKGK